MNDFEDTLSVEEDNPPPVEDKLPQDLKRKDCVLWNDKPGIVTGIDIEWTSLQKSRKQKFIISGRYLFGGRQSFKFEVENSTWRRIKVPLVTCTGFEVVGLDGESVVLRDSDSGGERSVSLPDDEDFSQKIKDSVASGQQMTVFVIEWGKFVRITDRPLSELVSFG